MPVGLSDPDPGWARDFTAMRSRVTAALEPWLAGAAFVAEVPAAAGIANPRCQPLPE